LCQSSKRKPSTSGDKPAGAGVNAASRGDVEGRMNRRMAVGVLGGLAFGSVATAWGRRALAQPVCTLTPEQIEGPFYLDQARIREYISEGKPGVPLQLVLRVLEASASCAPIPQVAMDVWHCDALGIYSGYEGAAIAPRHVDPVDDKTFLRGTQLTDAAGAVRFRTIYPGWYSGRTPHVHLKLRVGAKAVTTQLYFPDEVTNIVYARAPYDRHPNRDTTNAADRFLGPITDKSRLMWTMARDGDGYVATATVALRTS
jgi:protocatechuate 3,4-dioxygenase beta subunit